MTCKITVLFSLIAVLTGSGCQDFLTIEPRDEISRTELFTTIRGARAALIGGYLRLSDQDYYRDKMTLYPEMLGNLQPISRDFALTASTINTFVDAYALRIEPDYDDNNLDDVYVEIYEQLYQLNDLLDQLPAITDGEAAERASIRGEALALRALAHFDLLRLFAPPYPAGGAGAAGLPGIVLQETVPDEGLIFPARNDLETSYASVVRDLEEARRLIDRNFSRRSAEPIWLTAEAAAALLIRVRAYRSEWQAVVDLADELLAATTLALTPAESYVAQWTDRNLTEVILEVDLQDQASGGNTGVAGFIGGVISGADNPDSRLEVSSDLRNLYETGDLRLQLFTTNELGEFLSLKYPFGVGTITNPILLRLSEVYLLRAEALAELGRDAEARTDYDRIHQRALPAAPNNQLSGAELLAEIRRERRRELALEGHLLFDLRRRGRAIERTDCLDLVRFCSLPFPHPRFTLPLPQNALLRNPSLVQNDGY